MKCLFASLLISLVCASSAYAQRMYDGTGRQLGRIDGERIYDGSGRQIGRADVLRRTQIVIYFYFFM